MIFKKSELIGHITSNLAFSSKTIALENILGLFDNNRNAQEFFVGLFSLVFGYTDLQELDKLNGVVNYPAIDLGDTQAKIAFQVTTKSDSEKIKDTIKRFLDHKLYEIYDRLVIFIIGEKKSYTTSFDTDGKFTFKKHEDIWDDNYLIREIDKLDTEKLEKIKEFLEKNLSEFKTPERLFSQDIKSCINILKRDIVDILNNNTSISTRMGNIVDRPDGFIERKNKVNNISWDFFKEKIRGHLQYNKAINDFLSDPMNQESQKDYFAVTSAIQNFYEQCKDQFTSFEDVFRDVFGKLNTYDDGVNNQKIKIILHSMYFNCDIGTNPTTND